MERHDLLRDGKLRPQPFDGAKAVFDRLRARNDLYERACIRVSPEVDKEPLVDEVKADYQDIGSINDLEDLIEVNAELFTHRWLHSVVSRYGAMVWQGKVAGKTARVVGVPRFERGTS